MDPLTKKRLSKVPVLDRIGYLHENGLDREDAALLKRDPDAFNRKVGGTITKNLKRAADNGIRFRDYVADRAAARTKAEGETKMYPEKKRQREIRYTPEAKKMLAVNRRRKEEREQKEMERLMAQQNSSLSASGMMGGAEYGQDNKWRRNISSNEVAKGQSSSERIRDAMRKKKDRVR